MEDIKIIYVKLNEIHERVDNVDCLERYIFK